MKTKYVNLGLSLCLIFSSLLIASPAFAEDPSTSWPVDDFWNSPYDPSIFDLISFGLYGAMPEGWTCSWNFGDGTTSTDCWINAAKQYQRDGDYTVNLEVTNNTSDVSTTSRIISVRTHDVAITKFTVPQSTRAGQTRQLAVFVRNSRYPEIVQVDLLKSTANGFVWFGSLNQLVNVKPANQTTAFQFSYTFTAEDARVGKVTFKAVAILDENVRDALPADNEVISLPTRVSR